MTTTAEVKECMELYFHSPNTLSCRGAQLGKAQGQPYLLRVLELFAIHRFFSLFEMAASFLLL